MSITPSYHGGKAQTWGWKGGYRQCSTRVLVGGEKSGWPTNLLPNHGLSVYAISEIRGAFPLICTIPQVLKGMGS